MDLSIIIPVYNEEENLLLLSSRLKAVAESLQVQYELLFINDGSSDNSLNTLERLSQEDPFIKYLDLSRNFGHQVAVSAGLDFAKGDAVVIIDADLQDPPEVIPEMYNKLKTGYDVVYAKRRKRKGETLFKKWTAKLFYRILSAITKIEIPLDTGDFRVISRKVVEALKQMPERHKFLRGQIAWVGFDQTFISYDRMERESGQTGYTFRKMFRFALDGITSFSDFPLRIVTFLGTFVSVFAVIVAVYTLYSRFILKDYVQGWTSLMITILFIGGIQMIAIGIIGEYLSRMSGNVRNRPLYIIRDSNI